VYCQGLRSFVFAGNENACKTVCLHLNVSRLFAAVRVG